MNAYRFDPVDLEQMRLLGRLSPGGRIRVMLDARELAVGLIRGRLRRQYPDLSPRELNVKTLEELARGTNIPRTLVSSWTSFRRWRPLARPMWSSARLGEDVAELWEVVKAAARQEAERKAAE